MAPLYATSRSSLLVMNKHDHTPFGHFLSALVSVTAVSLMEDFQAAGLEWKKPCPFKWRCCNCFQLVRPAEGLIKRGLCTLQVMRIDITSLNTADNSRTMIDSASVIKYSPCCVKQLLVTTTANKLLKFDSRTGRILAEVW